MRAKINPSILAADFANFQSEIERIANADSVHVDVMDNHFVPNLTFGLPMVARLRDVSPIPLDVHLMIEDPDRWAPGYAEVGAQSVTFSTEAAADPVAVARSLRERGARAGIAVKPGTSIEPVLATLDEYDLVLVMTVEPGFGGQSFRAEVMDKVSALAEAAEAAGLDDLQIQVDGGIARDTILVAAAAGANTFVAGSSVFGAANPADEVDYLRDLATAELSARGLAAKSE